MVLSEQNKFAFEIGIRLHSVCLLMPFITSLMMNVKYKLQIRVNVINDLNSECSLISFSLLRPLQNNAYSNLSIDKCQKLRELPNVNVI